METKAAKRPKLKDDFDIIQVLASLDLLGLKVTKYDQMGDSTGKVSYRIDVTRK